MSKTFAMLIVLLVTPWSSVSATDSSTARTVVGTTASVRDSGWGSNSCSKGEPVKDFFNRPEFNCAMIGGEISIVHIEHAVSLEDSRPIPSFDLLVPAGVEATYPFTIVVVLAPASEDIAADTGVRLWASKFWLAPNDCGNQPIQSARCLAKLRQRYANEP